MDKVQKRGFIKYNTPSSEPFRIELLQVTFTNLRSEFYIVWNCNSTFLFIELLLTNERWLFAVGLNYVALWPWPKKRSSRAMSEAVKSVFCPLRTLFTTCGLSVASRKYKSGELRGTRQLQGAVRHSVSATSSHSPPHQCWKWICCCRNNY
jgi:hypothetical protein